MERTLAALLLGMILSACSGSLTEDEIAEFRAFEASLNDAGTSSTADAGGGMDTGVMDAGDTTCTEDILGDFITSTDSCATGGCHSGTFAPDLTVPNVISVLSDEPSTICGGKVYIDTTNVANSYLLEKLRPNPTCNAQMPLGAGPKLTEDQIACLQSQIEAELSGGSGQTGLQLDQPFQAEQGQLFGDFSTGTDGGAQEGSYVFGMSNSPSTQNGNGAEANRVSFSFDVDMAGTAYVWVRVRVDQNAGADLSSHDSYWTRMNGGDWIRFNGLSSSPGTSWGWEDVHNSNPGGDEAVPHPFAVTAGTNTFDIATREAGTQIDAIVVSRNQNFSPAD